MCHAVRFPVLLALFGRLASAYSTVMCTTPVCPKDLRPVRRAGAPKIWAYGCDVSQGNGTLNRCCIEKEICMRSCGMPWKKCKQHFERCAEKAFDMDEECATLAEEADVLVTGGESHFTVCKAYRDALRLLCDCVPVKEAKEGTEARLTAFYAEYRPERLDEEGKVKDIKEVWKKWQNREPELFFELAKKYSADVVELRNRSEDELERLTRSGSQGPKEASDAQLEAKLRVQAEAEQLRDEALRQRLSEEEALAEKELARQRAEQERAARRLSLERAKAAAVAAEDYLGAKDLQHQLERLNQEL